MASWTERLKGTLRGDVSSADVTAMLAALTPLDALRRQLADRQLAARIAHVGEEWRVCLDVASVAAPLWLADQLVMLAQSLCEAEAEQHPDRPAYLGFASHDLAIAALQPLETIISAVSAALVDPVRPSLLRAPLSVGPQGEIARLPLPIPLASGYLGGLLLAAERIHGAAGLLLSEVTKLTTQSPAPPWLSAALQRTAGDLAAAGARLGMLRTRLTPLLEDQGRVEAAGASLAPLCLDVWSALNSALAVGQMLADPRLLPGAAALTAPPAATATQPAARPPSTAAQPPLVKPTAPPLAPPRRPPPTVERVHDLPDIQSVPKPSPRGQPLFLDPAHQQSGDPAPLPDIGGPPPSPPRHPQERPRTLPRIEQRSTDDDPQPHELPQIGSDR